MSRKCTQSFSSSPFQHDADLKKAITRNEERRIVAHTSDENQVKKNIDKEKEMRNWRREIMDKKGRILIGSDKVNLMLFSAEIFEEEWN